MKTIDEQIKEIVTRHHLREYCYGDGKDTDLEHMIEELSSLLTPTVNVEEIKKWIKDRNNISYAVHEDLYALAYDKDGNVNGFQFALFEKYEGFVLELLRKLDDLPYLSRNSQSVDGIKKEFEERFGDPHGIHIPSNEIWRFFEDKLSK